MAIPILAFAATVIVLLPFFVLFVRLTKSGTIRIVGSIIFVLVSLPLLLFLIQFLLGLTVQYGVDAAKGDVPGLPLPDDASEITFYSKHGPTRLIAQFTIAETKFRNWMEQNERPLQTIEGSETVIGLTSDMPPEQTTIEIEHGLRWDDYDNTDENDDSGTTIVFDKLKNRVYIRVSLW